MSLKPCKFTPKGSKRELSYDEFRQYLLDNYDSLVEPPTGEAEGDGDEKRRVAARAKRVEAEQNREYKDILEDYVRSYTAVNFELAKARAQEYFQQLWESVEDGELTPEQAHEAVYAFAQKLIAEDDAAIIDNPNHPLHKTAFAMMAAQRMLTEAIENRREDEATMWNNFFDAIGRSSGTKIATLNAVQSLDPLANIIREITREQDTALNKKAKSGRKKKDIVQDIQDEVESAKREAADEAVEATSVDAAIDSATDVKAPEPKKRTPSKRAELEKREKAAIDRVKKAFASKAAPGPLMILSPENKEKLAALVELAKVEIEKGAYTSSEVVAAVFKKVGQYVSKRGIREAIESEWAELSALAQGQKQQDLTEMVKEAISGKSPDKIIQALGKALKIARPEYIKAQMKGRRITERQAIEEILANPAEAAAILEQALNVLRTEVAQGKHLDLAGGVKPKNLSQEQWDSARAKKVVGQFEEIVKAILGAAQTKKQERQDKQDYKTQVKQVIKDFYKNKNKAQSLQEYLAENFPEMSMQQINDLAAAVETEMKKSVERRDKTRIKKLVNEMTDGRDEANAMKVVSQSMYNRGAMNSFGFANLLSDFLGFKGVPQSVVNNVTQLMGTVSKMPPGSARAALIKTVNNMIAPYTETGWSYWDEILNAVMVKNILSSITTAFTGGLSVVFLTIPRVAFNLATRPRATTKGLLTAFDNMFRGKSAIGSGARDTFIEHRTPVARELPQDDNPYASDGAWMRTRNMSWREAAKMWKTHPKKAISHLVAKALINFTFQGRGANITNAVNDFMSFMDYMNLVALRDMYLSVEKQKQMLADGISRSDPRFAEELKRAMGIHPDQLREIEQQITDEENKLIGLGQPIPKGYRNRRTRELINEKSDQALLEEAHFKAVSAMGMGTPETALGASVHAVFEKLKANPKVRGQMNGLLFGWRRLSFPLTLFSRIMVTLGERSAQNTPIFGPLANMFPYTFTLSKDGIPMLRRNPDGTKVNNFVQNRNEYVGRIVVSTAVTTLFYMFLTNGWDDEEVVDPKTGKPVPDPLNPGENLTRRRYLYGDVIDFYGDNPRVGTEQRGTSPRNAVRVYDGFDEDNNPIYKDYPMQTFPLIYGILKSIGNERDNERYFDEQVMSDLNDEDKVITYLSGATEFDPIGLAVSAGVNSFSTDFSAITRIVKEVSKENTAPGVIDILLTQQAKSLVNPRIINDIERQVYNMTDRHKIYVNYKLKDDGLDKAAEYLMKDVWFTDPFIFDREKFESVDPFGNKIDFPPVYTDFIGMFGGTSFEAMAIHERQHKDQYGLYRNEKGQYDPQTLPYPKRYIYKGYTKDGVDVKVGTDLRRMVADQAYINHGQKVTQYLDEMKKMPYKKRAAVLEYLWDMAKYDAVVTWVPDASPVLPEIDGSLYEKMPEVMRKKHDAYLASKNLK